MTLVSAEARQILDAVDDDSLKKGYRFLAPTGRLGGSDPYEPQRREARQEIGRTFLFEIWQVDATGGPALLRAPQIAKDNRTRTGR
jgi:hypothetical protein